MLEFTHISLPWMCSWTRALVKLTSTHAHAWDCNIESRPFLMVTLSSGFWSRLDLEQCLRLRKRSSMCYSWPSWRKLCSDDPAFTMKQTRISLQRSVPEIIFSDTMQWWQLTANIELPMCYLSNYIWYWSSSHRFLPFNGQSSYLLHRISEVSKSSWMIEVLITSGAVLFNSIPTFT